MGLAAVAVQASSVCLSFAICPHEGGVNFSETQEIAQRMFERIFQLEQVAPGAVRERLSTPHDVCIIFACSRGAECPICTILGDGHLEAGRAPVGVRPAGR
eukprot:1858051-Amphidinium_carterae.1